VPNGVLHAFLQELTCLLACSHATN